MAKKEKKVIKPGKAITAARADDIRNKLLKIPDQNIKELVIDLAKVDTVDSVGLGLIAATSKNKKNSEGNLELINVSEEIYGLFHAIGFNQHFEIKTA